MIVIFVANQKRCSAFPMAPVVGNGVIVAGAGVVVAGAEVVIAGVVVAVLDNCMEIV